MEHRPHERQTGPQASRGPPHRDVGEADEGTPTASRGSCLNWRPKPGPTPTASWLWSVPTARSDRAYNWGDSAIAPDAVGKMTAQGLQIPFYFEYELRARHPRGVIARLSPYTKLLPWSNEPKEDQPPYPVTLFVVDTEEVEDDLRDAPPPT